MLNIYEDGTYLKNNPTWHQEDSPLKADWVKKIIYNNSLKIESLAEIGCGSGEILKSLSKTLDNNINYFGYEISPQAFDVCKKKENDKLNFFLKDLLNENKFFDVLLIIDVIEHIENYFDFLKKAKSKAKFKIFHIPLDLSVLNIIRDLPIKLKRKNVGHIHYFTKEIALDTLKLNGYKILDFFYTNTSAESPNASWKSKLLKIPRKLLFYINKDIAVKLLGGYSLMVLTE